MVPSFLAERLIRAGNPRDWKSTTFQKTDEDKSQRGSRRWASNYRPTRDTTAKHTAAHKVADAGVPLGGAAP